MIVNPDLYWYTLGMRKRESREQAAQQEHYRSIMKFFMGRGPVIDNAGFLFLSNKGFSTKETGGLYPEWPVEDDSLLDNPNLNQVADELDQNGFSDVADFVRKLIADDFLTTPYEDFLKEHGYQEPEWLRDLNELKKKHLEAEDQGIEEEQGYNMNLITNREAVIKKLIKMEGEDWFQKQESWGNSSIDGALKDAQMSFGGTIYGAGGGHRYFVNRSGEVRFSKIHGEEYAKKAQSLGFELI